MASYVCASQSRARAGGDHLVEIHHPAPPPADRRAAGLHPRSVFSIRAFFRSFCDRHSTKRFVAEQDLAREIPVGVGGRVQAGDASQLELVVLTILLTSFAPHKRQVVIPSYSKSVFITLANSGRLV